MNALLKAQNRLEAIELKLARANIDEAHLLTLQNRSLNYERRVKNLEVELNGLQQKTAEKEEIIKGLDLISDMKVTKINKLDAEIQQKNKQHNYFSEICLHLETKMDQLTEDRIREGVQERIQGEVVKAIKLNEENIKKYLKSNLLPEINKVYKIHMNKLMRENGVLLTEENKPRHDVVCSDISNEIADRFIDQMMP